jgi:hypothetical protein
MMKGHRLLITGVFFVKFCVAQNGSDLKDYLANNSHPVNLSDFSQGSAFFKSVMRNKILFVYGEGGSHNLELNNQMRVYLLHVFSGMNLKYFFIEYGRTTAFNQNQYLQSPDEAADSIYRIDTAFRDQMRQIKRIYNAGGHFEYRGIDMEWSKSLYRAVRSITTEVNLNSIDSIKLLRAILIDTSYFHYDNTNNFKNQAQFLKLYKDLETLFLHDSGVLKAYLSPDHYKELGYFLSNPQTAPPDGNRNTGMAQNLLTGITPVDANATYLLDIGEAHSLLNRKEGVIGLLNNTTTLSNKMMIMNVYCDNCTSNGKVLKDELIEFMKGDVLEAFRNSAVGDLTIFNLANAPAGLSYLKKYGDLILFAKNRQ